jgi:superfamily II DNA/RNA helicase
MPVPLRIADDPSVPSLAALRDLTRSKFRLDACDFQLEFAQAVLEGKKHVLLQAGCGMGKTLGFWIPLLARSSGFLIVVTPLTLLGDQHVENLADAGIRAINIDADTVASRPHVFEVMIFVLIGGLALTTNRTLGAALFVS